MNANSPYLAAEDAAGMMEWHAKRLAADARRDALGITQHIVLAHQGPPGSATLARTATYHALDELRGIIARLEADLDEQWAAKEARQREEAA